MTQPSTNYPAPPPMPKTSGKAIAALVLGLVQRVAREAVR